MQHIHTGVLQNDLQDLKKAMPDLAHGLQQLLDYSGDVESDIPTYFSIEEENFGEVVTRELKPGGSDILVTNSSREEYVRLYTQWLLNDSVSKQFAAFAQGFRQVALQHLCLLVALYALSYGILRLQQTLYVALARRAVVLVQDKTTRGLALASLLCCLCL